MRKLLITFLFIVLIIPSLAQEDDKSKITVPDLSGLSAAEAAAVLNAQNMLLDPIIQTLSYDDVGGTVNTIGAQSPEAGAEIDPNTKTIVSVSVIRELNLLLLYDPNKYDENDLTFVNTSEQDINLTGVIFQSKSTGYSFKGRSFAGRVLPAQKCFQIWGIDVGSGFYVPDECTGGGLLKYGIINNLPNDEHFWQGADTFTVMQDGIYRGSCEIAAGRCEVWISPQMIAEDVTEYAYFVYDEHELYVFNRSKTQWMPLQQIQLPPLPEPLNSMRIWSSSNLDNLDFLAPNQCVVFTDNSRKESLVDCTRIAWKNAIPDEMFWKDGFTVHSLHEDGIDRNCPPPSGKTFCLVPRAELK